MPLLPETNETIVNLRAKKSAAPETPAEPPQPAPTVEATPARAFSWQTPEYEERPRPKGWTMAVVAVAAVFAIFGMITENPLFAIIVALSAILVIISAKRPARILAVRVGENGILINGMLHPWESFMSFWVIAAPGNHRELRLRASGWLLPFLTVPIANQDPDALRLFIAEFLPEKEDLPSLAEIMAERLGF
ncbi:hypothetical protein HYW67_03470 [Candidatus Parcubacteria bacterium]|nr:hypothetical protein [Candidatus Parcubacteria bacterium]